MSGVQANLLLQGVANASPWLSADELIAPRKQAMFEQRNALLNAKDQQDLAATDLEMIARASAYLNTLPEDQRAAAYPGIVSQLQQSGFAKNAPAQYPGHERIAQLASMGTPSKELLEQAGVQRDYQAYLARRGGGGAAPGAVPAPGAAVPAAGGGFSTDKETARRQIVAQESGGDPTALNYVARQDPSAYARGATASGKYQFVNSTWRDGLQLAGLDPAQYPTAREAPEAVQDKVFDAVYAKYGTKPWEKGSRDWVRDEQGQYQLATVRPPAGAPGGPPAGTPAPYQTASLAPVPPPTRGSGGVVAGADGSGAPAAPVAPAAVPGGQGLVRNPDGTVGTPNAGGLGGAAPPAVTTPAPPAATPAAPAVPPPPPRQANGLTAAQNNTLRELEQVRPRNRAEFDALQQKIATTEQTYRDHNETQDRQYQQDLRAARGEARQEDTAARTAANEAERIRIAQQAEQRAQKTQGVPTGYQRTESGAIEPIPGYRGATDSERADYDLRHADPSSQEYADAWKAKKWQMAPNGSVIEQDMAGYPAPTRSIQRPTFLPQPTGTALDEVRKADTDAKVITSAIDHYVDVHNAHGGVSWDAYIANPRSKDAQQLLGAFDRLKTVLRSPVYYNTGVLQPAEMQLLKEDLVSPQTLRGLFSTPEALAARLAEIKVAVLTRQDAELRSVGKDGVIVRDAADYAKVPQGGRYYDENGNLKVKR